MRRWRLPDGGVLVEVEPDDAPRLLVLDPDYRVAKTYSPSVYSYEDDLCRHVFVVRGAQLLREWSIENRHGTKTGADVELEGLCELLSVAPPTPAEVRDALAAHAGRKNAAEAAIQERVADLARQPASAPPANPRQRQRLADRVVRYNDELAASVLALLDALADLHAATGGVAARALEATIEVLGEACAFVTFDPQRASARVRPLQAEFGSIPRKPTAPVLDALTEPRRRLEEHLMLGAAPGAQQALAVVDALEDVASALVFAADAQSYVDASQNAACYLQAAGLAGAAAAHLAKACQHILSP